MKSNFRRRKIEWVLIGEFANVKGTTGIFPSIILNIDQILNYKLSTDLTS